MHKILTILIGFVLVSCATQSTTPISIIEETRDISNVLQKNSSHPEILLVLDIDDTLLTADQFIGSDKWYEWQKSLPDNEKIACKFDVIGIANEIGSMSTTQPELATYINSLNIDKLVLTARSPVYRTATMRELGRNDFDFSKEHLEANGNVLRFSWQDENRQAVVTYDRGVYMVAGLNKGVLLVELLSRLEKSYTKIILVDDKKKNLINMQKALKRESIDFEGYWFTRVGKTVTTQEKVEGKAAELALKQYMKSFASERYKAIFENNECNY